MYKKPIQFGAGLRLILKLNSIWCGALYLICSSPARPHLKPHQFCHCWKLWSSHSSHVGVIWSKWPQYESLELSFSIWEQVTIIIGNVILFPNIFIFKSRILGTPTLNNAWCDIGTAQVKSGLPLNNNIEHWILSTSQEGCDRCFTMG